jgi:hypothetical protein
MSYDEYGAPDGSCVDCGEPTEEDHHWRCADCFREQQGWGRPARPEPGTPPQSFVAGLAEVRERLAVLEQAAEGAFDALGQRVAALERRVGRIDEAIGRAP